MVRRVRNSDFSIFDQLMSYCMIRSRDGFIRGGEKKKKKHSPNEIDFINKKKTILSK